MVKNLPTKAGDAGEAGSILCLEGKIPLEKEMATHFSILTWKNPMDRRAWQATVHGVTKSWTQLSVCAHMGTHRHTAAQYRIGFQLMTQRWEG